MVGNPWNYRGHNLEWSRIRLLTKWDDIEIDYNASGIRTRKGDTYYELDGDTIISETTNGNTIRYYYGNGGIVGFRHNGIKYYYEKNLQGDIVGIYDASGSKVAGYVYDAWGNCTITTNIGGIASVNPFRYRGYYYDSDIGLYYLKSRYYDAAIGRFINADSVNYLGVGNTIDRYSLFMYCNDNPIQYIDNNGYMAVAYRADIASYGGVRFYLPAKASMVKASIAAAYSSLVAGVIAFVCVDTVVESEREQDDERKDDDTGIFTGIDLANNTWKEITEPMDYEEAIEWVLAIDSSGIFGKGRKWGLYTANEEDALTMANVLSTDSLPEFDHATAGTYAHYHPNNRSLFGTYKHFHIWFGDMG